MRALATREERRVRALGENQRRLMSVDTAGNNFFRALHERVTLLEGVGFHGNSCAMIFRRSGTSRLRLSRPSARILFAGARVKPAKRKAGWSHYNSQPSPTPI